MQSVPKLRLVNETDEDKRRAAIEKRRLEIVAEIERLSDGRRQVPDSAYTTAGEVHEHRFWPAYILEQFLEAEVKENK